MWLMFESKYFRAGFDIGREDEFAALGGDFDPADDEGDEEDCDSGSCAEPLEYTGFGFGVANAKRRVSPARSTGPR